MVMQPRPQLLGAHSVDAWGTGVLLDASERLGKVPAGHELLPQAPRFGGVSGGAVRRSRCVCTPRTDLSDHRSEGTGLQPR